MVPLSAVLIAQNEEKTVVDALKSVAFCDEIVLVDSGSGDRTRELAAEAGARALVNAPPARGPGHPALPSRKPRFRT